MTPAERTLLGKLLSLAHPTLPQTNRFRLRKLSQADFKRAVESRGTAIMPPKADVLKAFADDLTPVCGDDTGGVYAEWMAGPGTRPIVYLSSEGETQIAATNARELFGLLVRSAGEGWRFEDARKLATWELLTLDADKPGDAMANLLDGPQAEVDDEVRALVAAHDVPPIDDVAGRTRAAAHAQLWPFIDKLDTIVTGKPVHRMWFDAWNKPGADDAPVFTPKTRYQIGDRLLQSRKDLTVRVVVAAHTPPNRVLLAHRSATFLCAYT